MVFYFGTMLLNAILVRAFDVRDPALTSYTPREQIRRLREEELPGTFGVTKFDEVKEIYREFSEAGSIYEPFVETTSRPLEGRFYGFTSDRFRRTAKINAWPPHRSVPAVFFFGGSTCFHVGPWWTGVAPAFRQMHFSRREGDIEVYNFGRSSYFSTQERILFEQMVLSGERPKLAIFLDGLNDLQIADGVPLASPFISSLYDRATRENQARYFGKTHFLFWSKLQEAWQWSAPVMLMKNIQNLGDRQEYLDEQTDQKTLPDLSKAAQKQQLVAAIERLFANWRMIDALGKAYGIKTVFVIQPVPVFGYNLKYHRFVPKEWPASMANVAAGYPILKQKSAEERELSILDLSDLQKDSTENLYVDSCHYTAEFSKKISSRIFSFEKTGK